MISCNRIGRRTAAPNPRLAAIGFAAAEALPVMRRADEGLDR
jgi:hypothetical protein